MLKQFKDLQVGQKFKWGDGDTYTKIEQEQISCCEFFSAVNDNNQTKIKVLPLQEVEVVE